MKKLKLDHVLAQRVLNGQKTTTWRLFDDKDLAVNDEVLLIDKVEVNDPNTWRVIGMATIDAVHERRLADVTDEEMGSEDFSSQEEMLAAYRHYYGPNVSLATPVKIIQFHFTAAPVKDKHLEVLPRPDKVMIYADGGSRGNPGPSACGYAIYDEHHTLLVNRGTYIGITTNNQAEYMALKLALEEAKSVGAREVHVYMDSMLVVNQMRGIFKVKNRDLWPIHEAAERLCSDFRRVDFTQIPRESNRIADAAVNAALDEHLHQQIS